MPFYPHSFIFLKIIAFFCCFSPALFAFSQQAAQVDTLRLYDIPEVTVTAEIRRGEEIRSTVPLQILSVREMERLNVLQVSDVVKHFSGVTVKDYGGVGGLKTVSVRSLGANHTIVNYDGIAVSDVQTGQIDIGRFSLDNVESVELISGQSDNIFMPARSFASASALNINTKIPSFAHGEKLNGKALLRSGSFGLVNPALTLNGKISQKLFSSFSGEYLYAKGDYPFEYRYGNDANDSTVTLRRKNTDVNNLRLEAALFGVFSEREDMHVKTYYYQSERGLPGNVTYYNPQQNSNQRVWDKTFFTQAHYRREFSRYFHFKANAKYNWSRMCYLDAEYLGESGKQDNTYSQQEYYASASLLYRAFGNLSFAFSADGFVNTMDADLTDFASPARYSLLSALSAKYVNDKLLATASVLNTLVKETAERGGIPENHKRFSPYVSVSVKPFDSQELRFRIFFKDIFRLPTFNDLYYTNVGNTDLKPETTRQYNAGVAYSVYLGKYVPLVRLTVDAYHNDVKNKIVALPSKKDIFLWSMVNFGKVSVNGLDLTGEIKIRPAEEFGFVLGTSYTYQRALNVTDPADRYTYRHQIPYTPRVSGSANGGLETKWINLSCSLVWSGHRYTFLQNYPANRLEGYFDYSVSLARDFRLSLGVLSAKVELLNLSGKNYQVVRGFPMPGRSFRTSVALVF